MADNPTPRDISDEALLVDPEIDSDEHTSSEEHSAEATEEPVEDPIFEHSSIGEHSEEATERSSLNINQPEPDNTMSRWLSKARTDHQAQGMAVAVKQEDRTKLTADALIKLQKATTEGMAHKFSLMSHNSDDQLVDCYNLTLRVEELKARLKETDTISGFDIFETALSVPVDPMLDSRLLDNLDTLTEPLVRATMKFKRYYGQSYDLQNLQWSQELIKNSCDADLATKVMERLRKIPDEEKGGGFILLHYDPAHPD